MAQAIGERKLRIQTPKEFVEQKEAAKNKPKCYVCHKGTDLANFTLKSGERVKVCLDYRNCVSLRAPYW